MNAPERRRLVSNRRGRLIRSIGNGVCDTRLLFAFDLEIASGHLVADGELLPLHEDARFDVVVLAADASRAVLAQFSVEVAVVDLGLAFEHEDPLRLVPSLIVALAYLLRHGLLAESLILTAVVPLLLHFR